jgi:hypothetical protein
MTAGSWMQETLRLRGWVLDFLAGVAAGEVTAPTGVWRLFIRSERCALPLKARLVASGVYPRLDPDARMELDTAARQELQRVLSARAHLRLIDRLAAQHRWDVVVLKGGAACLADADALDLADLDVLARPEEARALAAALDEAGYRDAGPSSPLHLEGRMVGGGLKIEVHTSIDLAGSEWGASAWSAIEPCDGAARLKLLSPRDHLWHLLVHVGVLHPYRRGAIRDSLLTAQALRRCSEGDLAEVDAQLISHPHGEVLQDLLDTARGLAGACPFRERFAYQAAVAYFVSRHGRRLPLPELLRADVGKWAVAFLSGWADMRREWGRVRMVTTGRSLFRPIARIEEQVPWLGRVVRVTMRVARVGIGAAMGAPLAVGAAYAAHRATRRSARTG